MKPVVAVIATGDMGAGVGGRLTENGLRVVTSLANRSAASAKRAAAARMEPVSDTQIATADFVLSIVPPGEAVALAERLAPALAQSATKPVYVDCNAISPNTVPRIVAALEPTGCRFVDAGIIGQSPQPGGKGPVLYASGPDADAFALLRDYGLDIRVLDGPLSAASALKMSYGGITKGMTAIATAMILAATRGGSAAALNEELQASFPPFPWMNRQVNGMYHRAYRWVAEMEEIADFAGDDDIRDMYLAISRLYQKMARDFDGAQTEVQTLKAFFEPDRT